MISSISIVCVEIENPGNLGAICRAMKNFGFGELILINPKTSPKNSEAIRRAKHAKDILAGAKIKSWDCLKNFDYVIGTTAKLGSEKNISRTPMTPEQLSEIIKDKKGKTAVLFGRDGAGLTNEEIKKCDFVIAIPTSKKYPAMNISHAAAIIFYEFFKKSENEKITDYIKAISGEEKKAVLKYVDEVLDKMEFQTPEKRENQKKLWRRIIGKSMLTKKEAFALCGFLRKLR